MEGALGARSILAANRERSLNPTNSFRCHLYAWQLLVCTITLQFRVSSFHLPRILFGLKTFAKWFLLKMVADIGSGSGDTRRASSLGDGGALISVKSGTRSSVRNFRQATSLPRIYRCASTDGLADFDACRIIPLDRESPEYVLLHRAGLILDLRSPAERDEAKATIWMRGAPGGRLVVKDIVSIPGEKYIDNRMLISDDGKRTVLRINVLSRTRLLEYLTINWLTSSQQTLIDHCPSASREKLRMDVLNRRGLPGLYEAIIKTSGRELCFALKSLTEYFEGSGMKPDAAAVAHCVQGKDRTGIVIMLCQSLIGLSDEDIILDYSLSSDAKLVKRTGSAAADMIGRGSRVRPGQFDWNVFSGAPREVMEATLKMVRTDFGSISPGYLDAIGFDSHWRRRFLNSVVRSTEHDNLACSRL